MFRHRALLSVLFVLTCFLLQAPAQAHIMVAQNGTLKLGKGGYYFVLSFPVNALQGFDDNGDGLLSQSELVNHGERLKSQVKEGFVLLNSDNQPSLIEGLLLNLPHDHDNVGNGGTHLVALGRFSVPANHQKMTLRITLYGQSKIEQTFTITITHGEDKTVGYLSTESPSLSFERSR